MCMGNRCAVLSVDRERLFRSNVFVRSRYVSKTDPLWSNVTFWTELSSAAFFVFIVSYSVRVSFKSNLHDFNNQKTKSRNSQIVELKKNEKNDRCTQLQKEDRISQNVYVCKCKHTMYTSRMYCTFTLAIESKQCIKQ